MANTLEIPFDIDKLHGPEEALEVVGRLVECGCENTELSPILKTVTARWPVASRKPPSRAERQ